MSKPSNAGRHTCDDPDWYTPLWIINAAREVMGDIDLDPSSDAEANTRVKAAVFFDAESDGLTQNWFGRVFLNPAGGKVNSFWRTLVFEYVTARNVAEAIWVGYSLEQLQTLQQACARSPLEFPICVPDRRIAFDMNEAKAIAHMEKQIATGKAPTLKNSPSHANYITYLGPNPEEFKRVFKQFGAVRL